MSKDAPKNGPGRPETITADIIKTIVNAIKLGAYVETAAALAGISKDTYYRWLKIGARSKREEDQLYRELSDAVTRAIAESEMRDLVVIDRAANSQKPDWRAAAWRLEHRFPERWGQKQTVKHVGHTDGPVLTGELKGEALDKELERLEALYKASKGD